MSDTIYIDRTKDAREAWVNFNEASSTRTTITKAKGIVYGDTWEFILRVVDQNGYATDVNGMYSGSQVKVVLANPGVVLATSSSMYQSGSWGWSGSMPISSSALNTLIGTTDGIVTYLQVQIGTVTYLQQKAVPIYFDAIA